ncbi:hypothetical protein IWX88_001595 [Frigoribacterium sp. CG_9.8]|nr:hypothetical protein [Frigoribacterium sp. CG_9.8]
MMLKRGPEQIGAAVGQPDEPPSLRAERDQLTSGGANRIDEALVDIGTAMCSRDAVLGRHYGDGTRMWAGNDHAGSRGHAK